MLTPSVDALADQIGRHCLKLIILAGRPAVFYDDVLALDKACFAQASAVRGQAFDVLLGRA
jgi:hypothetical protein